MYIRPCIYCLFYGNTQFAIFDMKRYICQKGDLTIYFKYILKQDYTTCCCVYLGNLVTDAVLSCHLERPVSGEWSHVSMAMWNSGGIGSSIQKGATSLTLTMLKYCCINHGD